MEKIVSVSCPLDCFDLCRFRVTVKNNQVMHIRGDQDHPITQGLICPKGKALKERFSHPDRIIYPLVRSHLLGKSGNGFEQADYSQVFDLICKQLIHIKQEYGPTAIIDYVGSGYGGLKGRIQSIFFNAMGGAARPEGSLCWGAGIAAQKYDFGSVKGHFPGDVSHSDLVLIWGRNPRFTNIHLYKQLKQAQKKGCRVITIDPIKTQTAKAFDEYIRVRPSTDAALALAMAKVIIDNNLHDKSFIDQHVIGFEQFKESLEAYTLKKTELICGVPAQTINRLALDYAKTPAACIYMGYGLQRYENGGNTIRCIDALAAIAGKIGKKGCGANYAARSMGPYVNDLEKESFSLVKELRTFTIGGFGQFLQTAKEPPVKAIFVSGTNPLNQGPDTENTAKEFSRIEFKVVFDHFMTDTARLADIVLPAASVFEQDDVFITSMFSPVLNYSHKAVDPPETIMPEFEFYLKLSQLMGIRYLGFQTSDQYLQQSVTPVLQKLDISFDQLKTGYPVIDSDGIAWEDLSFETPSGRIEIYSEQAKADGLSPLPCFIDPVKPSIKFPLRLMTCHSDKSMHSQSFAFIDDVPSVFLNENTAQQMGVMNASHVAVESQNGTLRARLAIDEVICDRAAFLYQGFWHKSGCVNCLTEDRVSDMGKQAAFYDTFCSVSNID